MSVIKKFLFENSFDNIEAACASIEAGDRKNNSNLSMASSNNKMEDKILELSTSDLEKIKDEAFKNGQQDGHKKGYAEAFNKAKEDHESVSANLLSEIVREISKLLAAEEDRWKSATKESMILFRSMISKILPTYFSKHSGDEIDTILRIAFTEESALTIFVNEKTKDIVLQHIAVIKKQLPVPDKVLMRIDKNLIDGACKITWKTGGIEHLFQQKWELIQKEIDKILNDVTNPLEKNSKNIETTEKASNT